MEKKSKNFLPNLSEPVARQNLEANLNQDEDLSEEELTGTWGICQGGVNPSIVCLQQSNCLIPFAGNEAD